MSPTAIIICATIVLFILMVGPRWWVRRQGLFQTGMNKAEYERSRLVREKHDLLLIELQEISRETLSRLGNKVSVLNTLIVEANEKIAELRKLELSVAAIMQAAPTKTEPTTTTLTTPTTTTTAPPTDGEKIAATTSSADTGAANDAENNNNESRSSETPRSAELASQPENGAETTDKNQHQQTSQYEHVYLLADAGKNPIEIASETGMQRGEIDLILRLRAAVK